MMDIQKIPAIQQKRIVTFVNHFIIDTISLLNRLINSSEDTLWRLEKRMQKLETTLKLLETKLNFIPDAVDDEKPEIESSVSIEKIDQYPHSSEIGCSDVVEDSIEVPAEIQKYNKMLQVGVPIEAVKLKMMREGFDPNLLH